MCKVNFKFNSGKDHWILETLSYNLWQTFPVIITEIKSTVQGNFLDSLGMEKLKKEKLFGEKFPLSSLCLQNIHGFPSDALGMCF